MDLYLLDTNTCAYYIGGKYGMRKRMEAHPFLQYRISEITVAELKFGVERSPVPEENREVVQRFISKVQVLPIYPCLDIYAKEKSRLRSIGQIIDDFDLLIGATAIANGLILVTNNEKHLSRMENIRIENWTK